MIKKKIIAYSNGVDEFDIEQHKQLMNDLDYNEQLNLQL